MVRVALLMLLLLWGAGCAPYVVGMPASRTEAAPVTAAHRDGTQLGYRVTSGIHYASATAKRRPSSDYGAGYVFERLQQAATPFDPMAVGTSSAAVAARGWRSAHGGYVEYGRRIGGRGHWRSFAGTKAEILYGDRLWYGVSGRIAWELFAAGSGTDSTGDGIVTTHGAAAMGVFVEGGYRTTFDGRRYAIAAVGITARLPSWLAFGIAPLR